MRYHLPLLTLFLLPVVVTGLDMCLSDKNCGTGRKCIFFFCFRVNSAGTKCEDRDCGSGRGCFYGNCYTSYGACKASNCAGQQSDKCCDNGYTCSEGSNPVCIDGNSEPTDECAKNDECAGDKLCYTLDGKCYNTDEPCAQNETCPKPTQVCVTGNGQGSKFCITPKRDGEEQTTIETTELTTTTAEARCTKSADCPTDKLLCYPPSGKCYDKENGCIKKGSGEYDCSKTEDTCVKDDKGKRFCIPKKDEEVETTIETTEMTTTTEAEPACEDVASANCDKVAYLCENKAYVEVMTTRCPKTCNKCPSRCTSHSACAAGKLCYKTDGNCYEKGEECKKKSSGEYECSKTDETCVIDDEGKQFCIKPKKDEDDQTTITTPATTTTEAGPACEDVASANCDKVAYLCENKAYIEVMTTRCPKTCNKCPTRCTSNSACTAGKLCYPTDGTCYDKGDACTQSGSGEYRCSKTEEVCVNGDGEGQKFCIKTKKDGDEQATTTTTPTTTTTTKAATGGCEDVASANCEKIAYLCENKAYADVMAKQCPKTCNLCPKVPDPSKCEDIADANCDKLTYLCNNTVYYDALTEKCPSTCKRC